MFCIQCKYFATLHISSLTFSHYVDGNVIRLALCFLKNTYICCCKLVVLGI